MSRDMYKVIKMKTSKARFLKSVLDYWDLAFSGVLPYLDR